MGRRGEVRSRSGLSLVVASIGLAASALVASALFTALSVPGGDDRSLRARVDLQLDAVRAMREIAGILENASLLDATDRGPEIAFRWSGADSYSLVVDPAPGGRGLLLRRHDADHLVVASRVVGRQVERIEFETSAAGSSPAIASQPLGPRQVRITAWFRTVVDRKVFTHRMTTTVTTRQRGE